MNIHHNNDNVRDNNKIEFWGESPRCEIESKVLYAVCVDSGWNTKIVITNNTGEALLKYALSFKLPKGVFIIGSPWADDDWAARVVLSHDKSDNSYIIEYNYSDNVGYALGNGVARNINFSTTEFLDIDDITNIQTFNYNDNSDYRIILQAPLPPNNSAVDGEVVIVANDVEFSVVASIKFGEKKEIIGLREGKYTVYPQNIEVDEYLYHPIQKEFYVILTPINPISTVTWGFSNATTYKKAYVPFSFIGATDKFDKLDAIFTITLDSTTDPVNKHYEFEMKFSDSTKVEVPLFEGCKYVIDCSLININNTVYSARYIEGNNYFTVNSDSQIIVLDIVAVSDYTTNNAVLSIYNSGLPNNASERFDIVLYRKYQDNLYFYTFKAISNIAVSYENTIKYGSYSVLVDNVVYNSEMYVGNTNDKVSFSESMNLYDMNIEFKLFNPVNVKGWPSYLAHGGITLNQTDFERKYIELECPIDSLFKYAGLNGGGDRGYVLSPTNTWNDGGTPLPTHQTILQARKLSELQGRNVMPVMVIYTVELSSGISNEDFEKDNMSKHYMNMLTECCVGQSYKSTVYNNPVSFIINPDFLGMVQQNQDTSRVIQSWFIDGAIPVNISLANALSSHPYMQSLIDEYGYIAPKTIPVFQDNIYGYIQSINWMIKQFAPDVPFGWQFNVWQAGSANWVHLNTDVSESIALDVLGFINKISVYSGNYIPDFIVFDRYERDDFGNQALPNYAWNMTSWQRYLNFTKIISSSLYKPSMLWQMPGSHMPTNDELEGVDIIQSQHAGSGATFFMGDDRIGTNPTDTVHPQLLNIAINPNVYGVSNINGLLNKDIGYDYSRSQLKNTVLSNVFSILWGGGSTTSVISLFPSNDTWLTKKLKDYYKDPVMLTGLKYKNSKSTIVTESQFRKMMIAKSKV